MVVRCGGFMSMLAHLNSIAGTWFAYAVVIPEYNVHDIMVKYIPAPWLEKKAGKA